MKSRTCLIIFSLLLALQSACSTAPKKGTLGALGDLQLAIDKDAPIDSARDKAMASYWDFMNNAPQDSLKIEALRRLADLELQKSEESFQEKLDKLNARQAAVSQQDEQSLKGVSYEKAIQLYEEAVAAADKSGSRVEPDVLYQLSKAYEETGNVQKSLQSLDRLLARYPTLENRDKINFRRGELLFKLGEFEQADVAYTQAMVVSPSSPYYDRAMSKRGWSAFKQREFDKALYSFFGVINRIFRNDDGSIKSKELSRGQQDFLNDTLRAITLSFNEMGGARAVQQYFEKNGGLPYEDKIYLALGDFYIDKRRFTDALDVYQGYANSHPMSPKAPLFELKGLDAMAQGGFGGELIKTKMTFANKYSADSPFWRAQRADVKKALVPLLSQNVEDIARYYHAAGQKSHNAKDSQLAQFWYRQYLKQFPQTDAAREINFLLAENLYDAKEYGEAAKEYEKAAYSYPAQGLDAEAAYAALLAYNKQGDLFNGEQQAQWKQQAIDGALRFAKAFPDDKRSPQVVTKAAEDMLARQQYDSAASAARTLLQLKNTDTNTRRIALTIIAKAEFEDKHYDKAESSFKQALAISTGAGVVADLKANIAASIYKQGELLRDSGKGDLAAAQFRRLATEAPDSPFNKSARFDLATTLLKQEHYEAAVEAFLAFRHDYPNDDLARKVSNNLAIAYNGLGRPVDAADELEYLMRGESDADKKRGMAWQIAQIYDKAGLQQQALDSYLYYTNNFPHPAEQAIEAQNKIASIYHERGEHDRYIFWLNEIIRNDLAADGQRSDRTKFLAANATYILAEPKLQQYNAIQLKAPLKTNLSLKKKRMKEAVDAYTRAANYGIADVTTAAYYHLGEIYGNFSKELMDSERPAGLSGDALQEYDMLLEEQAFPFEEKSISLYEENIRLIREGLYDEWVQKSFARLRKLMPLRYSKEERRDVVADLVQ